MNFLIIFIYKYVKDKYGNFVISFIIIKEDIKFISNNWNYVFLYISNANCSKLSLCTLLLIKIKICIL